MKSDRVYKYSFASVYPHYVAKAEKKGRTKAEVDEIIRWLTGYSQQQLEAVIEQRTDFETFLRRGAQAQPVARPDQGPDLRHPGRGDRRAADARDPLSRQADRRTGQGQGDGENLAERVIVSLIQEMDLKSLTYTSLAKLDLTAEDLHAIHRTARELNSLDGVTGLLVFNGTHFLQIIEGAPPAIDDLLARLLRDPRHSGLEVRDERMVEARSFPDWSMELVRVNAGYFEARDALRDRIPATVPDDVRTLLYRMTELISGTIKL